MPLTKLELHHLGAQIDEAALKEISFDQSWTKTVWEWLFPESKDFYFVDMSFSAKFVLTGNGRCTRGMVRI